MAGRAQVSRKIHQAQIVAISTEIGRGHPSYLDSVTQALLKKDENLRMVYTDVFHQSKAVSLSLWKIIRLLYTFGGRGGFLVRFYNLLRNRTAEPTEKSLILKFLGRDLIRTLSGFKGICLVAHPLLARILAQTCSVWYVHGEIAAPVECAVPNVRKIFVPLEQTRDRLISYGADPDPIVVCGLMLEPSLSKSAEQAFHTRIERISSSKPLTVGFFTSGAYPAEHLEKMVAGAKSVVHHGMKAIIFAGTDPPKLQWFKEKMRKSHKRMIVDDGVSTDFTENWDIKLVYGETRQAETKKAAQIVPHLDLFVAPSHERTNWAVGLGLPMFVLFPLIGTFSPQNFEFAHRQGVCYAIDTMEKAQNLGKLITELRESKKLTEMARKGLGIYRTNGSEIAATHILGN